MGHHFEGLLERPLPFDLVTLREALQDLGPPNGTNRHVIEGKAKEYRGHLANSLDTLSRTLRAGTAGSGPGGGNNTLCDDNGNIRYFTIREMARIQGFPDDYKFDNIWSHAIHEIGNAVPPPLARLWLRRLIQSPPSTTSSSVHHAAVLLPPEGLSTSRSPPPSPPCSPPCSPPSSRPPSPPPSFAVAYCDDIVIHTDGPPSPPPSPPATESSHTPFADRHDRLPSLFQLCRASEIQPRLRSSFRISNLAVALRSDDNDDVGLALALYSRLTTEQRGKVGILMRHLYMTDFTEEQLLRARCIFSRWINLFSTETLPEYYIEETMDSDSQLFTPSRINWAADSTAICPAEGSPDDTDYLLSAQLSAFPSPAPLGFHDDGPGRKWHQLGADFPAVTTLSSAAFSEWLRQPIRVHGHGSGLLAPSSSENSRRERQFVLSPEYAAYFRGAQGLAPFDFHNTDIPSDFRDSLLRIQEVVARKAYGSAWQRRLAPISIQITEMDAFDDRGDHNDLPRQGTFIASYTARGSGEVRVCYTRSETPPANAPRSRVNQRPQMIRTQHTGSFYLLYGQSLEDGILHGVSALEHGRLSITYRFNIL